MDSDHQDADDRACPHQRIATAYGCDCWDCENCGDGFTCKPHAADGYDAGPGQGRAMLELEGVDTAGHMTKLRRFETPAADRLPSLEEVARAYGFDQPPSPQNVHK